MNFLNKLERKYGRYAVRDLMKYIVFANAAVYILNLLTNDALMSQLYLYPPLVLRGQVWRLITFIMVPPSTSMIFIFFALYFYYMIGGALEQQWGSFKFNVYYFSGVIFMIAGSFLTGTIALVSYLNLTLFLAFATFYPDFTVRVYFILPVKIKYMAYLSTAFLLLTVITGSAATRISILASMLNYILFFGKDLIRGKRRKIVSASKKQAYAREIKKVKPEKEGFHRCEVCQRTEKDDPNLEFRYCSKCEGYHEYCSDHLFSHEHIKEQVK
ncbi:MAG: hypothetical protein JW708_04895 [Vallitaleaceae bacterium]|nr:hypothetical protein [Vallitaleaceae bacterium]